MYGLVNQAVRGLVLDRFGADAWQSIHSKAGVPAHFVAMQSYDDSVTYDLVSAASEVLDLRSAEILHAFGEYWVLEIAVASYPDLMSKAGVGFMDFVKNLDHLHSRIKVTFPHFKPPSFRVIVLAENRFQLDYFSQREGLLPFVEGLLQGLASHFDRTVSVEHIDDQSHPLPSKRMIVTHERLGA